MCVDQCSCLVFSGGKSLSSPPNLVGPDRMTLHGHEIRKSTCGRLFLAATIHEYPGIQSRSISPYSQAESDVTIGGK